MYLRRIPFRRRGRRLRSSQTTGGYNEIDRHGQQTRSGKYLALKVSEVKRGVYVKPVGISLLELWERCCANVRTHKRFRKRDVEMYGNLHKSFRPVNLVDRNSLRVEEFQQYRSREVSPATGNRETALLKYMFNMAGSKNPSANAGLTVGTANASYAGSSGGNHLTGCLHLPLDPCVCPFQPLAKWPRRRPP